MCPPIVRLTGKDVSDPTHCNNPHLSAPRYNFQGKYLGSLPDLGTARRDHACATFVSSDGEEVGASIHKLTNSFQKALLVVGGRDTNRDKISSTEIYMPSTGRWTSGGNLPRVVMSGCGAPAPTHIERIIYSLLGKDRL